jgi:hypothetical protein
MTVMESDASSKGRPRKAISTTRRTRWTRVPRVSVSCVSVSCVLFVRLACFHRAVAQDDRVRRQHGRTTPTSFLPSSMTSKADAARPVSPSYTSIPVLRLTPTPSISGMPTSPALPPADHLPEYALLPITCITPLLCLVHSRLPRVRPKTHKKWNTDDNAGRPRDWFYYADSACW